MRFRYVGAPLRRLFDPVKTGTKSFIYNRPKRLTQFGSDSPRSLDHVVID